MARGRGLGATLSRCRATRLGPMMSDPPVPITYLRFDAGLTVWGRAQKKDSPPRLPSETERLLGLPSGETDGLLRLPSGEILAKPKGFCGQYQATRLGGGLGHVAAAFTPIRIHP